MILRRRTKPLPLEKIDAILPRLSPRFYNLPALKKESAQRYKGYIGERKVDYFLNQLPSSFLTIQDVCLKTHGKGFQIDSLLISHHAIYLIEVKNYGGTITFNPTLKQFTRNNGNHEEGFSYPLTQVENTQHQLTNWLHDHHFYNIPIYSFIAISEPSTIIKVVGEESQIAQSVTHGEHLLKKILNLDKEIKTDKNTKLQTGEIGQAILRACVEFDIDIFRNFNIKIEDIMTGVQCPECSQLAMYREFGVWQCNYCQKRSKYAHLKTLSDHFRMGNKSITNKECRKLLHLDSRSTATRILKSSHLIYQKEHRYWIPKKS